MLNIVDLVDKSWIRIDTSRFKRLRLEEPVY